MSVFRFVRGYTNGFVVIVAALMAAACQGREHAPADNRDDFGDPLPAAGRPARIVSLSPATTELLFALGVGERLVGRTRWDVHPPEASRVPDVGDGIRPNIEAVLAARPDLVVLYTSDENRDAARAFRAAGLPTVALRMDLVEDFVRATRILGSLVGEPERAALVIDTVTATLERVRQATASRPRPTVFLHAWEQPLLTIGPGSHMSELVEIAGGRNVFDDLRGPSPAVTFEEVLRRNPDVVLAGPIRAAELRASPRWRTLPAVRDGRVLVFDTLVVGRPGVRLGEAARNIANLLHPGAVP